MICIWPIWCHWHPIISCFIKTQIGLTVLVPAYAGCRGKEAVKRVSVCHRGSSVGKSDVTLMLHCSYSALRFAAQRNSWPRDVLEMIEDPEVNCRQDSLIKHRWKWHMTVCVYVDRSLTCRWRLPASTSLPRTTVSLISRLSYFMTNTNCILRCKLTFGILSVSYRSNHSLVAKSFIHL